MEFDTPTQYDPDPLRKDSASDAKAEEVDIISSLVQSDADDFPDGGLKAWVILCGTVTGFFSTFGYVNSWGVFQAYYQQKLLHHSTPSEIAWIGSIQHALFFLPALVVGRMFDIGYFRIPFAAGGLLIVLTAFLVPECKVYWHFMLCQGVGVGIGGGLMFCTMITIVTHWWKKRRGFALGVTSGGGALGATVLPIVIRQLIVRIGFSWAMRTLGFILAFFLFLANVCIARRLRPIKAPGGLFGLHVFRSSAFVVLCVAAFTLFLGLFTMSTYINSSAIVFGISPNFAFYLVAVVNFSAGVGRIVAGMLGDRFGAMNIAALMTAFTGVTTIAWPFCRTIPRITVISVLYGFFSGAWIALIGSMVGQMGGIEDIGRRIGALNTIAGIGTVCGPPISGLFASTSLGYIAVGYFAGAALLVGGALIFISRLLAVPEFWRKY
ncbi:major facilitator superfamily domain-containing protein [Mycena maculata]|uniref:Major facilitator superfamily domain-containing protein n=1 Tax=Mycena maculata TaxID=230809 RepID=A0AAD7P113_9AGAR|nr:major facilitator superfamily domain-containing protein [Mycena maculata]